MSKWLKLAVVLVALGLCSTAAKAQTPDFMTTADCVLGITCWQATVNGSTYLAYTSPGGGATSVGLLFPGDMFQSGYNGLVTMIDSGGVSDQFVQFGGNFPGTLFNYPGEGGAAIYEGSSWTLAQVTSDPNAFNFTCSEDGTGVGAVSPYDGGLILACSPFGTGSGPFTGDNAQNAMTGINWTIVGASDNGVYFDPYHLGHDNSDVIGATSVPEPSGLLLLGTGLLGLGNLLRRHIRSLQ